MSNIIDFLVIRPLPLGDSKSRLAVLIAGPDYRHIRISRVTAVTVIGHECAILDSAWETVWGMVSPTDPETARGRGRGYEHVRRFIDEGRSAGE